MTVPETESVGGRWAALAARIDGLRVIDAPKAAAGSSGQRSRPWSPSRVVRTGLWAEFQ